MKSVSAFAILPPLADVPKTADIPKTGLVCLACMQPVVIIENMMPGTVVLHCPACGHRWAISEPEKRAH